MILRSFLSAQRYVPRPKFCWSKRVRQKISFLENLICVCKCPWELPYVMVMVMVMVMVRRVRVSTRVSACVRAAASYNACV